MTDREVRESYCDDNIQLARYRYLVQSLCSKEVLRIRGLAFVETLSEAVFAEEPLGVHVSLHELCSDSPGSDVLYEVSSEFFVNYYGRIQLQELSVAPVSSESSHAASSLPWEDFGDDPDELPFPDAGCDVAAVCTYGGREGGEADA